MSFRAEDPTRSVPWTWRILCRIWGPAQVSLSWCPDQQGWSETHYILRQTVSLCVRELRSRWMPGFCQNRAIARGCAVQRLDYARNQL